MAGQVWSVNTSGGYMYATRGNLAQRRRALSLMGAPKASISKSSTLPHQPGS